MEQKTMEIASRGPSGLEPATFQSQVTSLRQLWPSGMALAWQVRGAGFESPRDQNFVLGGSFCALTSSRLNCYLISVIHLSLSEP